MGVTSKAGVTTGMALGGLMRKAEPPLGICLGAGMGSPTLPPAGALQPSLQPRLHRLRMRSKRRPPSQQPSCRCANHCRGQRSWQRSLQRSWPRSRHPSRQRSWPLSGQRTTRQAACGAAHLGASHLGWGQGAQQSRWNRPPSLSRSRGRSQQQSLWDGAGGGATTFLSACSPASQAVVTNRNAAFTRNPPRGQRPRRRRWPGTSQPQASRLSCALVVHH